MSSRSWRIRFVAAATVALTGTSLLLAAFPANAVVPGAQTSQPLTIEEVPQQPAAWSQTVSIAPVAVASWLGREDDKRTLDGTAESARFTAPDGATVVGKQAYAQVEHSRKPT